MSSQGLLAPGLCTRCSRPDALPTPSTSELLSVGTCPLLCRACPTPERCQGPVLSTHRPRHSTYSLASEQCLCCSSNFLEDGDLVFLPPSLSLPLHPFLSTNTLALPSWVWHPSRGTTNKQTEILPKSEVLPRRGGCEGRGQSEEAPRRATHAHEQEEAIQAGGRASTSALRRKGPL